MNPIEQKILEEGTVIDNDIIKVDSFLNHQIDVKFLKEFAAMVKDAFPGLHIDKVLTIETSGLAVAYAVSEVFDDVPMVFAKKSKSKIVGPDVYKTNVMSFTRGTVSEVTVSQRFLNKGENILIVDDFLAEGNASLGLIDLCTQAGAVPVGVAVVIEKEFQGGRKRIESLRIPVFSGASIKSFQDNKPRF